MQEREMAKQDGRDSGERTEFDGREDNREPRKRHGDALEDGSGTRHGVEKRDERPDPELPQ